MTNKIQWLSGWMAGVAVAMFAALPQTGLAASEKEQQLIGVLQSDAPSADKAITCKQLAIYGSVEAVPVLAPLLQNPELASWARIALEAIPGPAADAALREALGNVQGALLIGVINSLGVRRDAQAVAGLAEKLNAPEVDIVAAAAEALGHIGGAPAARSLNQALARAPEAARPSVAYGCILCAEQLVAQGQRPAAIQLYDSVRNAKVPAQRVLEATRGAILARQADGLPLLLAELRASEKARFHMALRTARELPGRGVTQTLEAELERLASDWRLLLFLAIADREDDAVLPAVLRAAQGGFNQIRAAALERLDRFRDARAVPVLFDTLAAGDPDLATPAKATLARMDAQLVDAALLERLPKADGDTRRLLIELATQRRLAAALPTIMESTAAADAGVRRAALEAASFLGTDQQVPQLVRQLAQDPSPEERERLERALLAVCGRSGAPCLPHVMPLLKSPEPALRQSALRLLASLGGAHALAAVMVTLNDPAEAVQDEAVGTLATWPNNWPDDAAVAEPLLRLARSGKKPAHQIQGLRGYLLYVQEHKAFAPAAKVAKVKELLPLLKRPEEKRLVIAAVSSLPTGDSLDLLLAFTEDPAIAEEACLALVKVATDKNLQDSSKEQRRSALQTVLEKSKNDQTKKNAQAGLKQIR